MDKNDIKILLLMILHVAMAFVFFSVSEDIHLLMFFIEFALFIMLFLSDVMVCFFLSCKNRSITQISIGCIVLSMVLFLVAVFQNSNASVALVVNLIHFLISFGLWFGVFIHKQRISQNKRIPF